MQYYVTLLVHEPAQLTVHLIWILLQSAQGRRESRFSDMGIELSKQGLRVLSIFLDTYR